MKIIPNMKLMFGPDETHSKPKRFCLDDSDCERKEIWAFRESCVLHPSTGPFLLQYGYCSYLYPPCFGDDDCKKDDFCFHFGIDRGPGRCRGRKFELLQ